MAKFDKSAFDFILDTVKETLDDPSSPWYGHKVTKRLLDFVFKYETLRRVYQRTVDKSRELQEKYDLLAEENEDLRRVINDLKENEK